LTKHQLFVQYVAIGLIISCGFGEGDQRPLAGGAIVSQQGNHTRPGKGHLLSGNGRNKWHGGIMLS